MMCWECGGTIAANLLCNHDNPNPDRLSAAKRTERLQAYGQWIECPDCGADLKVTIEGGKVLVLTSRHRF